MANRRKRLTCDKFELKYKPKFANPAVFVLKYTNKLSVVSPYIVVATIKSIEFKRFGRSFSWFTWQYVANGHDQFLEQIDNYLRSRK